MASISKMSKSLELGLDTVLRCQFTSIQVILLDIIFLSITINSITMKKWYYKHSIYCCLSLFPDIALA